MGELILCKRQLAATPYYIEEMSLNIYSLEELSYYISHNVYLINHDFMNVDICNFIGRDLGMRDLSNDLLDLIANNAKLAEFVSLILSASGYLTRTEIKETVAIIAAFENKSDAECRKMRGDRLLEQDRYIDAIYDYETLLEQEDISGMTDPLKGDIWHNLGTCYARLFFFTQAAECYHRAYELNHKVVSLKALLCCYKCNHDDEAYAKAKQRYFVSDEAETQINKLIAELSTSDSILGFDRKIDDLRENSRSGFNNMIDETVSVWKKDYNKVCRI